MKEFINPEVNVLKFSVEDVITTSNNEYGENETPEF